MPTVRRPRGHHRDNRSRSHGRGVGWPPVGCGPVHHSTTEWGGALVVEGVPPGARRSPHRCGCSSGIGWSSGWGGAAFAGSLTSLRVVVVGPLALTIIAVILVVERLWPAQQRPFFARGYRHDLLFTVVNATLVLPLVTL